MHWLGRASFRRWFPLIEERARRGVEILPPCRQIDDPPGVYGWRFLAAAGRPSPGGPNGPRTLSRKCGACTSSPRPWPRP